MSTLQLQLRSLRARKLPSTTTVILIFAALLIFSYVTNPDPGSFAITVFQGLFRGMLLFLVAAGLSIIFGLMDVLNFAQGTYFMLGAYVAYSVHHSPQFNAAIPDPNLRFLTSVLIATGVGAILGAILERFLLRPLYSRPIFQIVLTFGVSIVLTEAIRAIWSTVPYSWTNLFSFREGSFLLFDQPFSTYRLFVIAIGALLIVVIALLLRRTRLGLIIRAGVEDSLMVEALGINVRMVFTLVFMLGCAMAAFGGAIAAPFLGATIGMGNQYLLWAIAVVVIGGMGSYEGTAVGSLIVSLAMSVVGKFSQQFLNQPVWEILTPMVLLMLVLLAKPSGLFGKEN
ncbi:MAG: branched-chain amino acid ABC transporter permease [Anaerolineae bacterium]|nr:branched-chain amino acid ABC transporter permease [Anaerolineae bacterium]